MKKWILLRNGADYDTLSRELNIDPVAVRIMVNRGITELSDMRKYLSTDISETFAYDGLPNLDLALEKIKEAKEKGLKSLIVGDYDADGVCAVVILMKGLKLFGLECDYVIPNRLSDGYGINENIVRKAYDDGYRFIITCDNGISARASIDLAVDLGMEVVVTDHHTITESEVPTKTKAIVNPKLEENAYPFTDICGAQVAYKLLCALLKGNDEWNTLKDELVEFAAIACVVDVMPLVNENRNLVKYELLRLKEPINQGLKRLVEKNELNAKEGRLVTTDISFRIGPCINSAGRIEVADCSVNLFLSESKEEREALSDRIIELNNERKELTERCVNDGVSKLEELYPDGNMPNIILLYLPDCHVAICGLVAGRIRENTYRPTFIFTDSNEGLTGSGRSIDEYNMIEGLQRCSDLLTKFGGHKQACGCSLKKEDFDALNERLNAESGLSEEDLTEKLLIDADMPFGYVTERLINDLYKLEPFGNGNRTPVFALRNLTLFKAKRVGENHIFIKVKDASGNIQELKLWRKADEFEKTLTDAEGEGVLTELYDNSFNGSGLLNRDVRISVSYYPGINNYMDRKKIEFTLKDFRLQ